MRTSRHTEDSRLYFDWLESAARDLLAAQLLTEAGQCLKSPPSIVSREWKKALKAYLIHSGAGLPDGHNLTWLCRQALRRHPGFERFRESCADMNRLYIAARYPSDEPLTVEPEEAEGYCRAAGELYDFICDEVYARTDGEE